MHAPVLFLGPGFLVYRVTLAMSPRLSVFSGVAFPGAEVWIFRMELCVTSL